MKIPLTSRKKLATLKAAALLPEFEMEVDANWLENSEEEAAVETMLSNPPAIDVDAEKAANALAAKLDFNG